MTPAGHGVDDLVTGEAVVLELPSAGIALRLASGLLDVVARVLVLVVVFVAAGDRLDDLDDALIAGAVIVVTVGVLVVGPALLETATGGRTLGKRLVGLRTVRDDGGRLDLRRALTRHLLAYVEVWLLSGVPALLCALFTRRGVRLGDLAAGTFVARDRVPLRLPTAVPMPPSLAGWARAADIGPLPAGLVAQARYLVHSGSEFTPEARTSSHAHVATALARHVSPPPPSAAPAEEVVRAVLAERHRRAAIRLEEQEHRRRAWFGG